MSFIREFREFAVKGSAIDMAVGIIIGAAFGKIVTSIVNDLLMPPLGRVLGAVDFRNLFINLGDVAYPTLAEAQKAGAPTLNYGNFIQTVVDFVIISFAIFLFVRALNAMRARAAAQTAAAAAPPARAEEIELLKEIRDTLRSGK